MRIGLRLVTLVVGSSPTAISGFPHLALINICLVRQTVFPNSIPRLVRSFDLFAYFALCMVVTLIYTEIT